MALGGWSRSHLIDVADRRTDRRATKKLDLDSEFFAALQEFCLEFRWPWRKKTTAFALVPGERTYDMTDPANMNAIDFHIFQQRGLRLIMPNGDKREVTPVFDTSAIQDIVTDASSIAQSPTRFFIQPAFTINFNFTPDQAYPGVMSYWAVPNGAPDAQDDVIPLVPGYLHHVLCKKLELQILRFTIGEGSAKYLAVQKEYDLLTDRYQLFDEFSTGKVNEFRDQSETDFVQST